MKIFSIALLAVTIMASNALAGFSSYDNPYRSDSVIAPIQIKDRGVYNLVISIQFLNEPYDQKNYKTDAYGDFIKRLNVEWSGVVLQQVLAAKELDINDLVVLKTNIEAGLIKLADELKGKYSLEKNIEVVFSLSNFYLLEPKVK